MKIDEVIFREFEKSSSFHEYLVDFYVVFVIFILIIQESSSQLLITHVHKVTVFEFIDEVVTHVFEVSVGDLKGKA